MIDQDSVDIEDKLILRINKMLGSSVPVSVWEQTSGIRYGEEYARKFKRDLERIKEASVDFINASDISDDLIVDLGKQGLVKKFKESFVEKIFNESSRNMYLEDEIILESKLSSKDSYVYGIADARKKLISSIYKDYRYSGNYETEGRLFASKSSSEMQENRIRLWNTLKVADIFKFFSKDEMSSFIGGGSIAFRIEYWKMSGKIKSKFSVSSDKIFQENELKYGQRSGGLLGEKFSFKFDAYANLNIDYARSIKGKGTIMLWSTFASGNPADLNLFPVYLKLPARIVEQEIKADLSFGIKATQGNSRTCDIDPSEGFAKSYLDARLLRAMYDGRVKTIIASPVYEGLGRDFLSTDESNKKKAETTIVGDNEFHVGDKYKYMVFLDSDNGNILAREYSYPDIESIFFNKQLQLSYRERSRLKKVLDKSNGKGIAINVKEQKYKASDLYKYPLYKETKAERVYALKILETKLAADATPSQVAADLTDLGYTDKISSWYDANINEDAAFPLMKIPKIIDKLKDIQVKLAITLGLYRMGGASSTKTINLSLPFCSKFRSQHYGSREFSSAKDSMGKIFQDQYKTSGKLKEIKESGLLSLVDKTNLLQNYRSEMSNYTNVFTRSNGIGKTDLMKGDEIDYISSLTKTSATSVNKNRYDINVMTSPFSMDDRAVMSETVLSMGNATKIDTDSIDFIYKQFSFVNYIKNGEILEFKGDKEKISKFAFMDFNYGSDQKKNKDDVDIILDKDCYYVATERNSIGYVSFNGGWDISGGPAIFDNNLSNLSIGCTVPVSKIKSLFVRTDNLYSKYNIDFFSILDKLDLEKTSCNSIYDFVACFTINGTEGSDDLYNLSSVDRLAFTEFKNRSVKSMKEWIIFVLNDYSRIFNEVKFESSRNTMKKVAYDLIHKDYSSFKSWIHDRLRKFDDLLATEFKMYLSELSRCSKEFSTKKVVIDTSEEQEIILNTIRKCVQLNISIYKKILRLLDKIRYLGLNNTLNGVRISESHLKLVNVLKMSTETHIRLFMQEMASVTDETGYSAETTYELFCMFSECLYSLKDFGDYASSACLPIDEFVSLLSKGLNNKQSSSSKLNSTLLIEILLNYESLGIDSIFVETIWECSTLSKVNSDLDKLLKCVTNDGKSISMNETKIVSILSNIPSSIGKADKAKKKIIADAYLGFRVLKPSVNKNSDSVTFPVGVSFNPISLNINIKQGLPIPLIPSEINIPAGTIISGIPDVSAVLKKYVDADVSLALELSQTSERGVSCLELLLNVPKNDSIDLNVRFRPIINV